MKKKILWISKRNILNNFKGLKIADLAFMLYIGNTKNCLLEKC